MKSIYLSGPISEGNTASPEQQAHNMQAFARAKTNLEKLGYKVLSPLDNGLDQYEASWEDHLKKDIVMLMESDAIMLLPRWEISRGSILELDIATTVGINVLLFARGGGINA